MLLPLMLIGPVTVPPPIGMYNAATDAQAVPFQTSSCGIAVLYQSCPCEGINGWAVLTTLMDATVQPADVNTYIDCVVVLNHNCPTIGVLTPFPAPSSATPIG